MGIIKAVTSAIGGALADTYQEVIEAADMKVTTCFVPGVPTVASSKGQNQKGTANVVSNGSVIHVYDNQFMMLIDGGRVVDYTAEPGYFKVDNSSMPSLFNGQFGDSLKEAFNRIKFGGTTSQTQRVFFINLQEMRGIRFGTPNPVNYYDQFYDSELFIRAFGTYSIKVTNPLLFYTEVIAKGQGMSERTIDFQDINEQYSAEFIEALAASINQYSADGNRISFITSKSREIGQYMSKVLDADWTQTRGMQIQAVGVNISYDQDSQELIKMRNKGAMLKDKNLQQGYVAANISEGLKDAGSNGNGAMAGFMGMGVGMNAGANILGGYQQNPQNNQPQQQMQPQQPQQPQQQTEQPQQQAVVAPIASADGWTCECGTVNTGKFCSECGSKKPEAPKKRFCTNCGAELSDNAKFCPECGTKA